jgi:hypothetical protein
MGSDGIFKQMPEYHERMDLVRRTFKIYTMGSAVDRSARTSALEKDSSEQISFEQVSESSAAVMPPDNGPTGAKRPLFSDLQNILDFAATCRMREELESSSSHLQNDLNNLNAFESSDVLTNYQTDLQWSDFISVLDVSNSESNLTPFIGQHIEPDIDPMQGLFGYAHNSIPEPAFQSTVRDGFFAFEDSNFFMVERNFDMPLDPYNIALGGEVFSTDTADPLTSRLELETAYEDPTGGQQHTEARRQFRIKYP